MEIIIIVILSIINIWLLYFLFSKSSVNKGKSSVNKKAIRICPLCGSRLTKPDDCVYGEYFEADGKKKIYIYGCNYCYKGKKRKRITL